MLGDDYIVVVGSARVGGNDDFAIVRYEADGDLDPAFGNQGKTTTDFFGLRDRAYAVAVFADNSIVVVGDAVASVPPISASRATTPMACSMPTLAVTEPARRIPTSPAASTSPRTW